MQIKNDNSVLSSSNDTNYFDDRTEDHENTFNINIDKVL